MSAKNQLREEIIKKAVVHGKVILSSGKEADYYVDLRRVTLDSTAAPLVGEVMLELTKDLEYEAVGGLTLGADPVATAMLHIAAQKGRKLDAFVVRKAEKGNAMKTQETVRQGGKNIFEDLKLPDAEELNVKVQIAYRICELIQKRKLTQQEAACLLGTDQPRVSALLRGRLEGFSSDRLFRFLNALDQEIEIVIRQTRKRTRAPGIRVLVPA